MTTSLLNFSRNLGFLNEFSSFINDFPKLLSFVILELTFLQLEKGVLFYVFIHVFTTFPFGIELVFPLGDNATFLTVLGLTE